MRPRRVLMTGATGSYGRLLANELLARGCELVLLVRGRDGAEARRRAYAALGCAAHPSVHVVRGDTTVASLGLSRADAIHARSVDTVVHAAATTEFGLPLPAARRANVEGTRNTLTLACQLPRLEKFVHVSTAFVAGKQCGRILETVLRDDAAFVNSYERSKWEAERLVRDHENALPVAILRPSVVVEPVSARKASALWFTLRLIARGVVPVLPGAPTNPLDLIPAPDAAAAGADLILAPDAVGTFHLASGDRAPRVADVVAVGAARSVRFVDRAQFAHELVRLRALRLEAARSYDALGTFIELLAYPKTFDTTRVEAALGRPPVGANPLEALVCRTRALRSAAQ
jgi:nucleoside-diphosphate-sugar epimerase